jgi:putative ABC transport system permease protein
MFKLNFKIALRNLWNNKGFTLINVGGLAIGLASCMVLLMYVAYEWSYNKQVKNYDKTYVIYLNSASSTGTISYAYTPGLMAGEISAKIPGVAYASHSSYPSSELISYQQKNFKKSAVYADPSFLKILDYKFIKGNPEKVLQETNSVILTETMAKNLFGEADPMNQIVKFQNNESLKVEGVIEDVPENSTIQFDYLLPWSLNEKLNVWVKEGTWGSNYCLTLLQLKDNKYLDNASTLIKGIYKRNLENSQNEGLMHPLSRWHLYDKFENGHSVGGKIDQVRIFMVLAFCILLIACVNFMNLSTARSEKRSREVGVRKAIGSSRQSLVGQFLMESMMLSFIGMLISFILMEISLPYLNSILNIQLAINYQDWRFWTTLAGLTLLTGFIAGSYPAFYLSSFEPVKVLKGFTAMGRSSLSVRRILVIFQFVFAACLIVCTGVIYQQLNFIKNKPIGYNRNNLIEIPAQGNLKGKQKLDLVKDQLLKSGAVTAVTYFSHSLNQSGDVTTSFSWPGKNLNDLISFNYRAMGHDFAETTGAKIIAGRAFSSQFVDTLNVMVNETAVKIMGLKQPVGTVITWGDTPVTIVGVMKDFVIESPYQKVAPLVMYSPTKNYNYIIARLNSQQNLSASVAAINKVIKQFNPDFPVDYKFVNDDFEHKLQNEKLLGTLSNWFGGFAIFISCIGLLGLALFMAEQRKKEIGIRKVLGASTYNILRLLNKDFIKLVAAANLIAFPIAYIVINRWLSAFEFRISISFLPFAIAIGLSLVIAILTVSIQSLKVVRANPVDALKYE